MRACAAFAVLTLLPAAAYSGNKLTFEDRIELTRGLTAEYATVKQFLPRSKKPLPFEAAGTFDKAEWDKAAKEFGPAARVGDLVQITKIEIGDDRIILLINGGMKGNRKWYQHIEVGGGGQTSPVSMGDSNAVSGTTIAVLYHKPLEPVKASVVKKLLAPVLDFEKRSATELYSDTLPPEVQQAIKNKKVLVGMDREQVILAVGRPAHKSREVKDGIELEDWVFGQPPGKIVFVTFEGSKVVKVKEAFAGLGTEVSEPRTPR
jgi:hypothetical protein